MRHHVPPCPTTTACVLVEYDTPSNLCSKPNGTFAGTDTSVQKATGTNKITRGTCRDIRAHTRTYANMHMHAGMFATMSQTQEEEGKEDEGKEDEGGHKAVPGGLKPLLPSFASVSVINTHPESSKK